MSLATMRGVNLQAALSQAQLPALPQSAIRLLELARNPKNGPEEFARPIEADPGLAGQVLKFINSAYFGFSREISSVKLAITIAGVRTIKNFTLWTAVFNMVPNPKCGLFELPALWQDSLRRALFARAVGRMLELPEAEDLFAAALLQDMAVPLLAKAFPQEYAELLARRADGGARLSQLESAAFGWNHGQAAGEFARRWNLPEGFAQLVEGHADWEAHRGEFPQRADRLIVSLSALLPAKVDAQWPEAETLERAYEEIRTPDALGFAGLLDRVDAEYAACAPLLRLAGGGASLAERYQKALQPSAAN